MMRRSITRIGISVVVSGWLFAATVFAQRPTTELGVWTKPIDASGIPQTERPARREDDPDSLIRLIVTFRGDTSTAMTRAAVQSRTARIVPRIADLRRDLARLDRTNPSVRANATTGDGPVILHTYSRVLYGASIRVRRDLRDAIRALPYVASVREDREVKALLADSVPQVGADRVWAQYGNRGAGVRVAVIDSGIDYRHPALGGGFGAGFKVEGGYDFVDRDEDPMDVFGHGTHVAGIIAGNGAGITGVAPDATLLAYRALEGPHENSKRLNPGVGSVFKVDLGPATSRVGVIDLRIHVEDDTGNGADLLLEPAFVVGSTGRRRSVGR